LQAWPARIGLLGEMRKMGRRERDRPIAFASEVRAPDRRSLGHGRAPGIPERRVVSGDRAVADLPAAVGIIGERSLARHADRALSAAGMEVVRIGAAEARERLGQGLDVLVVSGGNAPEERISTIRRLCERAPGVAVVVVLRSLGDGVARAMLAAGARGVVLHSELDRTLAPTVRAARIGQVSIPQPGRRQIFPPALSHRESTVLAMVAKGQTNAEIASSLFLAESTVKSHLRSVFAKLGVNSRQEAAAVARASLAAGGPDLALAVDPSASVSGQDGAALSVGGRERTD
jgi:DNA-binding NarL/FixJ family response regulator